MALSEKLQADLKEAMRAGDALRRDTLRMVLADMKNRRIELGKDLDEAEVEAVLRRGVKTRTESAEQYDAGARPELAEKERAEIAVLEGYLPKQMGEDEVRQAVKEAIAETGASSRKDTGAVMKALMAKHKGRVDGKLANRILAELLD
jgi:uncharacterized protein YqeY